MRVECLGIPFGDTCLACPACSMRLLDLFSLRPLAVQAKKSPGVRGLLWAGVVPPLADGSG